ncbi:MAG: glycosyltransferase family 2 protein, partial [Erysipelotrichaceae bacterium]|nr:glycosyltransferase family 2 protein [Erysipelotrichaceae bacterium]
MCKVSVIVAIYNVEQYLEKCIKSILAQTYKDFEVILVHDGSPDNCLSICRKYEALDERVVVLDKPNGGLSDARNAGMKIAKGKYVSFVDADDFLEDTLLEKCIAKLEEDDSDMVMFDIYQYYLKENKKEIIRNPFDE